MNPDPPKKKQSNQNDIEHTDPADLPFDENHPSAAKFVDFGLGAFSSTWSVTDKDGKPIKLQPDE